MPGAAGIDVPRELSIVGYGDSDMTRYACLSLTTVAVPVAEWGYRAAKLLMHQVEGTDNGLEELPPARLEIGESTGRGAAMTVTLDRGALDPAILEPVATESRATDPRSMRKRRRSLHRDRSLVLLAIPAVVFFAVFSYAPLAGLVVAFKDFNVRDGVLGKPVEWSRQLRVLLQLGQRRAHHRQHHLPQRAVHRRHAWSRPSCSRSRSTRSGTGCCAGSCSRRSSCRHFISPIVISVMLQAFLAGVGGQGGLVNEIFNVFSLPSISWYQEPGPWPWILTVVKVWQLAGYFSIIYLAAITAIPEEVHEAGVLDGASRAQMALRITLPPSGAGLDHPAHAEYRPHLLRRLRDHLRDRAGQRHPVPDHRCHRHLRLPFAAHQRRLRDDGGDRPVPVGRRVHPGRGRRPDRPPLRPREQHPVTATATMDPLAGRPMRRAARMRSEPFTIVSTVIVDPVRAGLPAPVLDHHLVVAHRRDAAPAAPATASGQANFSLEAYAQVLGGSTFVFNAYLASIVITVVGTALALSATSGLAWVLSRRESRFSRPLTFVTYIPMLLTGGLVPFYILVTQVLQLRNTWWAVILPLAVSPFLVFVQMQFFREIPQAVIDSARIDGANELRIFFTIVLPLSKPILAVIGLFYGVTCWNEWFTALLFISDKELQPLQQVLAGDDLERRAPRTRSSRVRRRPRRSISAGWPSP